jgi:hypothetical protein
LKIAVNLRRISLRLFVRRHNHDLPRRFLGKFNRNLELDSSLCNVLTVREKVWEYGLRALESGCIKHEKPVLTSRTSHSSLCIVSQASLSVRDTSCVSGMLQMRLGA